MVVIVVMVVIMVIMMVLMVIVILIMVVVVAMVATATLASPKMSLYTSIDPRKKLLSKGTDLELVIGRTKLESMHERIKDVSAE